MKGEPVIADLPISTRIIDYLEADGGWLELDLLADEVHRRFPHFKRASIHRVAYRLVDRGALELKTAGPHWERPRRRPMFRTVDRPFDIVNENERRGSHLRRSA